MHLNELLTVSDVEKRALTILPIATIGYYRSGADEEKTLKDNEDAFGRFLILPKMLVNVSSVNLEIKLFGYNLSMPFAFAPSAMHKLAHPDGESATAGVAAKKNMLMVLSTLSTTSMEDVAKSVGYAGNKWFQLYVYKDRQLTLNLVRRAETAGYNAIVLTVDAPFFGRRLADCRSKFFLPQNLSLANFDGSAQANVPSASDLETESGLFVYIMNQLDQSLTWEAVDWLRSVSKLPIIVKGILTAEDAEVALSHGVSGIIVSNHGARQIDSVPAAIDALPRIVKVVNNRCPVMMDGGVRKGTDILKALALGAKLVFIGRPVLYGLAVGGKDGVTHIVDILEGELRRAMALAGCPVASQIAPSLVCHRSIFNAKM